MFSNYLEKVKKSPSLQKAIGVGILLSVMVGSTLWDFQKGSGVYEDSIQVFSPSSKVTILTVPKGDYTKEIEDVDLKEYIFTCLRSAKESRFGERSVQVYDIFISMKKNMSEYRIRYDVSNRRLNFWPSKINADGSKKSGNNYVSSCTLDEFNEKLSLSNINS